MNRYLLTLILTLTWALSSYAQKGLNVAQFFTDTYKDNESVTIVEVTGTKQKMVGIEIYRSITVVNNEIISRQLEAAVKKDGAKAKSKEVIYKKGELYFGMYCMGGTDTHRRYLYFLNQRVTGKDKTMLIFIEGSIPEELAKTLVKM